MAKEFSRTRRIGQQLQQELAMILMREMKDPRIGMVTVNDVDVSRDLSFAKVFVTFFEDDPQAVADKLAALEQAAPYIRTLVAGRMKLRVMPELKFAYDASLVEGMRMSNLVSQVIQSDKAKAEKYGTEEGQDSAEDNKGEQD